ncbi:MAG: glutamyl-tRNA reductase [Deltaproteobacteria bacterium RIFOXYD12_FULL_50_9]|nr:MAG: glutamyl-tRNA reductase [Deltaproteobacteria bacterium RIFOXYD12_FULL_50_9]
MSVDSIVVLGVNHKTAPVAIREQLAFSGDIQIPLRKLMGIPHCVECCFLSTCNRVEVIFTSSRPDDAIRGVRGFLFENSSISEEEAIHYTFLHQGQEAIIHLFRVASSLDSMIVGEPQILGQLKDAFRDASEGHATGAILNRLMHKSFSVAKRIRTETNIGSSAVSISYAAVELAKKIFGELKGKKVMLVGAGEMAELAAEHLINQGVGGVVVANRTLDRAVKLARRFNGSAVALTELVEQLEGVDILISSTGAPGLILTRDDVKPVMRQRKNKPLFLIDIAVPRDLDPELNKLDNVYLYDIDDLTSVVEGNKAERDKEAGKAERIVAEETLKFLQWLESMQVSPTIIALRQKVEALRDRELARTFLQLKELPEKEKRSVEILAASLVNKLIHDPMLFLKAECPPEEKQQRLALFRQMFGLDQHLPSRKDSDETR